MEEEFVSRNSPKYVERRKRKRLWGGKNDLCKMKRRAVVLVERTEDL